MIDQFTVQRIKESADIVSVVSDYVQLHPSGRSYQGLCPFHDDRHLGSFVVSPQKNICRCWSCEKTWNSVDFIMEKENMKYIDALKYLGSKFGTYIEDGHPIQVKKAEPRKPPQPLSVRTFPLQYVRDKMDQYGNVLINWLRSLPWNDEDRKMLDTWLKWYGVGTMKSRSEFGWTVWWYINEKYEVTEGKLMKYTSDGHRDKSKWVNKDGKERPTYSFNWISSKMEDAGFFDSKKEKTEHCLFGLHMLNFVKDYPDVKICICESEKSALIAQTLSQPDKRLWMATGGKGGLTKAMLKPLIEANRKILLFPDHDSIEDWKEDAKEIGYSQLQVSDIVERNWIQEDGEKADIADILIRMQLTPKENETEAEKAHRLLKLHEENIHLTEIINQLDLKVQ